MTQGYTTHWHLSLLTNQIYYRNPYHILTNSKNGLIHSFQLPKKHLLMLQQLHKDKFGVLVDFLKDILQPYRVLLLQQIKKESKSQEQRFSFFSFLYQYFSLFSSIHHSQNRICFLKQLWR